MKKWKRNLLKGFSLFFCTIPAFLATLHYFPIWYREDAFDIVVPGIAVLCFCLCSIPLFRWIERALKSPSVWMMWLALAILLHLLERIFSQVSIICDIGAGGNMLGAVLWKIAEKGEDKK